MTSSSMTSPLKTLILETLIGITLTALIMFTVFEVANALENWISRYILTPIVTRHVTEHQNDIRAQQVGTEICRSRKMRFIGSDVNEDDPNAYLLVCIDSARLIHRFEFIP